MSLENKAVIVTGASSGIGLEIVKRLADEGANIALAARTQEKLEKVAADLGAQGVSSIAVPTDVTREADCQALVRATVDAFGGVDIVVNNAGYGPPGSLADTTEEIWDATIDSCLKSVYLMTRAATPVMLEAGHGKFINISSVAGKYGFNNRTAYCAAKWGLHGFTEAFRAEFSERNLRAYLICPAAVATPWWGTTNDPQPDEIMEKMIQPEDVAEAVIWTLKQPDNIQIDEIVMKTFKSPWA